jgi:acetate kinase
VNTLVLIPGRKSLRYAGFIAGRETCTGTIRGFRWQGARAALDEVRTIAQAVGLLDDATSVVVHGLFGGEEFPGPALVNGDAFVRLDRIARQSPLHVAGLTETAHAVQEVFPRAPARLAFETSFFVDLPARERTYAMSPELAQKLALRRWGYHGLFHEAASLEAGRGWRKRGFDQPARILSICLEAQPEIAAVLGRRPITVTSGATPLEGLPGETNSGEIDPAVALALAGEAGLGPEGANALLVGGSGLSGLVGHRVRLDHVLASKRSDCVRARDVLLYRMLMASGTAAAALGGVDAVVFSGRYASCSAVVAQHVLPHLERAGALGPHAAEWTVFAKPLEAVLADTAIAN